MGLQKILIADGSEDFLLAMVQALQQRYQVLCCQDGKHALSLLRSQGCDLLILDLMLPQLDGLTMLELAQKEGLQPVVLATTLLHNAYVEQATHRLGVSYLIRKPCTVAAVAARAEDLLTVSAGPDFLTQLLESLSLSSRHDGFDYFLLAIPSYVKNPRQAFTKELYPAVGKPSGHSGNHVERAMRSCLDAAWERRDPVIWQKYFPDSERRPTPSEFIHQLAKLMREPQV